eukprot:5616206-Lingulodinium_polyedra.AAC.1
MPACSVHQQATVSAHCHRLAFVARPLRTRATSQFPRSATTSAGVNPATSCSTAAAAAASLGTPSLAR